MVVEEMVLMEEAEVVAIIMGNVDGVVDDGAAAGVVIFSSAGSVEGVALLLLVAVVFMELYCCK